MLSLWFIIVCICLLLQMYLSKKKYGKYILIVLSIIFSIFISIICFNIDFKLMDGKGIINYKALIRDTIRWFLFLNIPTLLFILINHKQSSKEIVTTIENEKTDQ